MNLRLNRLNPIVLGLLCVTLPVSALAAERSLVIHIDEDNPSTLTLEPGDTVTANRPGAAIVVSGAGNVVHGNGIAVTAGDNSVPGWAEFSFPDTPTFGLLSVNGANATLADSTINMVGTPPGEGAGLAAMDTDSLIRASGVDITIHGTAVGANATDGGRIELDGGSILADGRGSLGLLAYGPDSVLVTSDVNVSATGPYGQGVRALHGGSVTMRGGKHGITGSSGNGVRVDPDSMVSMHDAAIEVAHGMGALVRGGRFVMDGGSLTSGGTVVRLMEAGTAPAGVEIRNATLTAVGDNRAGINVEARGAAADIDRVSITTLGEYSSGVWLSAPDTALHAANFLIRSSFMGVDNGGGVVTLTDGAVKIEDENGVGLYNSIEYGDEARLSAARVSVEILGADAFGVTGEGDGVDIDLDTVAVTIRGTGSTGLSLRDGAVLTVTNSTVDMKGADGIAGSVIQGGTMSLNHAFLHVTEGKGLESVNTDALPSTASTIIIRNGSEITVGSGVALSAFGSGSHTFQISDSQILARQTGDSATGLLLETGGIVSDRLGEERPVPGGQVRLNASNTLLTGDVIAYGGTIDVSLKNGSELTGALEQDSLGRINSLTLDDTSAWTVRGDSRLGTLNNGGAVAFAASTDAAGFRTLVVNDYVGSGTLLLHTQLGGDNSPTDRLVIDGGAVSGSTSLRIVNAGGNGGRTARGIRVVETVNGATTASDAFLLDSGSSGYRASSGTLSINGHDYSLMRGGDSDTAADWFLSSAGPGFVNISPEGGAYAGNRQAAINLFSHSAHDRVPAYASGDGADAQARRGRRLWVRVQGRHDEGLRLSEGRVDVDTDSAMLQLGGDLLAMPACGEGAVHVGLMGGYGDARSRSVSTLALSGGQRAHALARGKVSGYAAGLYATWYQDDLTHRGAWADTWMQYGRYSNRLSSELGASDYRSDMWSASLEAGYAFQPFASGTLLKTLVVEPHAQVVYDRYRAGDAAVSDMRLRSGAGGNWQSRIGARLHPDAANAVIRPFLEANWLHSSANPVVRMGDASPQALSARNAFELKAGAQARVGAAWRLSTLVFGQVGNGNLLSYGGAVNVSWQW